MSNYDAGLRDGYNGYARYSSTHLMQIPIDLREYNNGYQQGKQDRTNEQNMYDYEENQDE